MPCEIVTSSALRTNTQKLNYFVKQLLDPVVNLELKKGVDGLKYVCYLAYCHSPFLELVVKTSREVKGMSGDLKFATV